MRRIVIIALLLSASLPAYAGEDLSKMSILQAQQARSSGQAQQSLAIMQQAYAQEPGNPEIILNLGYALIANGQARDAVNLYDMLAAMQPENPLAYNAKAVAFDHTGNHFAAQELYDKALSLAPNSPTIKNNLAMSYILDDKPAKAVELLKPLASRPDVGPIARQNLALAYGLQGDSTNALAMNLKDLPEKEATENLKFYEHYKKLRAERLSDEEMSRALLSVPADKSKEVKLYTKEEEEVEPEKPTPVAQAPKPQPKPVAKVEEPKPVVIALPEENAETVEVSEPAAPAPVKVAIKPEAKPVAAKPQPTAKPQAQKAKSEELKAEVISNLSPAAGGGVALPKGYKPSPSVVDNAQVVKKNVGNDGEDSFFGYKSQRSYPGQ